MNWIPYIITVLKKNKSSKNLLVENKMKRMTGKLMSESELIREMELEEYRNIVVPRYVPMHLSQRRALIK